MFKILLPLFLVLSACTGGKSDDSATAPAAQAK